MDMEFGQEAGREKDGAEAVLIGAEAVRERHELALGRIRRIEGEGTAKEPWRAYFERTARFILLVERVYEMQETGLLNGLSLDRKSVV